MRSHAVVGLACLASACTLLESEDGLVGAPLDADAGIGADDGGSSSDGEPRVDSSSPDTSTSQTTAGPGDGAVSRVDGSDASLPADGGGSLQDATTGPLPDVSTPTGPVAIYTGRPSPVGIGVHAGTVCWVEGQTAFEIACAPTSGAPSSGAGASAIQIVATSMNDALVNNAFDVALDGTYYYWSNGPNNQIVRKPIAGGGASAQYFTGDNRVSYIVLGDVTATDVWASDWGNGGTQHVVVGPSASNAADSMLVYTDPTVAGVGVYSGSVYWGSSSSYVAFAPEQGNATAQHVTTSGPVTGLAVDPSTGTTYVIVSSQKIYKLPLASSDLTLMYDAGSSFGVSDLAVDDAVYWSENANGQIMRMAK